MDNDGAGLSMQKKMDELSKSKDKEDLLFGKAQQPSILKNPTYSMAEDPKFLMEKKS